MARLIPAVCMLAVCALQVSEAATTPPPTTVDPTTLPPTTLAPSTPAPSTPAPTTPADLSCMLDACPSNKAALVPSLCRCQAYFSCDAAGVAQPKLCKPWQNFHPTKLECVYWDLVDCTWVNTITTRTPPTTPQPPPVPGCDFVPTCPATGSSKQGIPCKDSCKYYIQCKDGKWSKEKCAFAWPNFDTKSGKCVMWGAKCAA